MAKYKIHYQSIDIEGEEHSDTYNYEYHKTIEDEDDIESVQESLINIINNYWVNNKIVELMILSFSKFE